MYKEQYGNEYIEFLIDQIEYMQEQLDLLREQKKELPVELYEDFSEYTYPIRKQLEEYKAELDYILNN